MDRRNFLRLSAAAAGSCAACIPKVAWSQPPLRQFFAPRPPAWSVIPVVGDGHWIWTKPPENETGYLEPREYEVEFGIELQGRGNAYQVKATTPVPVTHPEQEILSADVETFGAAAQLRQVSATAGELIVAADGLAKGQRIGALARMKVSLRKQYHGFERDRFSSDLTFPVEFRKAWLFDSPGIQTRLPEVRRLSADLGGQLVHPWDKAHAYYEWVWKHIRARIGSYTSVAAALRDRVGDCEERASVFVALCRAAGIPARLVWVPNHNWAEFYLVDTEGQGHWIPAHTACYSWFGWTGVHELVLQKGDSIEVPEQRRPQRLLTDWMQWGGARPEVHYTAELRPLPGKESSDAGPGARRKDAKGEWVRTGQHPLDARVTRA